MTIKSRNRFIISGTLTILMFVLYVIFRLPWYMFLICLLCLLPAIKFWGVTEKGWKL
jgi:hypothetical protein